MYVRGYPFFKYANNQFLLSIWSPGDPEALLGLERGKGGWRNIKAVPGCVLAADLFKKLDAQPLTFVEDEGNAEEDEGNSSPHFIFWLRFSPAPPWFPWVVLPEPIIVVSAAAKADWKLGSAVITFVAAAMVSGRECCGGEIGTLLFLCM